MKPDRVFVCILFHGRVFCVLLTSLQVGHARLTELSELWNAFVLFQRQA